MVVVVVVEKEKEEEELTVRTWRTWMRQVKSLSAHTACQ